MGAAFDDGSLALPAAAALRGMDDDERSVYIDVLSTRLDATVLKALEQAMFTIPPGYRYTMPILRAAQDKGIAIGEERGEKRGEERGRREALLDLASKLFAPEVLAELAKVEDVAELSARVQKLLGVDGQAPKPRAARGKRR